MGWIYQGRQLAVRVLDKQSEWMEAKLHLKHKEQLIMELVLLPTLKESPNLHLKQVFSQHLPQLLSLSLSQ